MLKLKTEAIYPLFTTIPLLVYLILLCIIPSIIISRYLKMTNLATLLNSNDGLTLSLRRLMAAKNISEAELARRTQIPQPTLHKIISGKTEDPRASTLKSLAHFFDVTIDMLLSGKAAPASKIINTQSIAIIPWADCLNANSIIKHLNSTNWDQWIITEYSSTEAFALPSKPSMEPRFPKGTTLIFDSNISPEDGDLVLAHFPNTTEATLRELTIDGPIKQLIPICKRLAADFFNPEIRVIGVLVKSIFKFH